jgi:hypothetical protein
MIHIRHIIENEAPTMGGTWLNAPIRLTWDDALYLIITWYETY